MAPIALALHALLCGCSSPTQTNGRVTDVAEQIAVLSRQATPTEIQASVMAFADKYSSRAGDLFDRIHDEAQSSAERVEARRAKVSGGLGATTIAAEVNPVAALLDMVTMVSIKQMSFRDHGASSYSPEHAQLIQAMHDQSADEVWSLAGRFLSDDQRAELRDVIDDWYANNPEVRTASYVRLQDFTTFRRESPWRARNGPASVLRLLHIDPLANMDPIAREIQESRMLAERALFFAKRIPPLASWQLQLATADLLATPELKDLLRTTESLRASADRFVASSEQFALHLDQMPEDVNRIVAGAIADLHQVIAAERSTAIDQASAAIDAQRATLMRDVGSLQRDLRDLIADVNKTIVEARATVTDVGQSAQDAVTSARVGATDVVDLLYHRVLVLILVVLIGVPIAMLVYRWIAFRIFGDRRTSGAPHG
ncbi:MAG: hypothetical protein U0575_15225 [Phycisphaerales bacterium]